MRFRFLLTHRAQVEREKKVAEALIPCNEMLAEVFSSDQRIVTGYSSSLVIQIMDELYFARDLFQKDQEASQVDQSDFQFDDSKLTSFLQQKFFSPHVC